MPVTKEDYTGRRFNKLVAIKNLGTLPVAGERQKKRTHYLWRCDCGTEKALSLKRVRSGNIKSCGCLLGAYQGIMSIAYGIYSNVYNNGTLTFEEWLTLSQQNCFYCNRPPSNNRKGKGKEALFFLYNGVDRINSDNEAHNSGECVPCCWPCNERKRNTAFVDYLDFILKTFHNLNLQRFNPTDGYSISA